MISGRGQILEAVSLRLAVCVPKPDPSAKNEAVSHLIARSVEKFDQLVPGGEFHTSPIHHSADDVCHVSKPWRN
jgi:hypothetical protein